MTNYNQYTKDYTRNGCGPTTLLNIMKYRYGITVNQNFIMTFCTYLAKFNFRNTIDGAVFSVLYRGFVLALNWKLGLKFKVEVNQISNLTSKDTDTYGIGIKSYSTYKFNKISKKGYVTKKDMDYLNGFNKTSSGHNAAFDGDGKGYWIDTNGTKPYKFPLEVLKYGQTLDLFWDNIRTISPANNYTKKVVHLTIRMFQAEQKGKLDEYLKMNKNNRYIAKAKELYLYGR